MAKRTNANDAGSPLDTLSEAIESGAGLPSVARAAAEALGASVALIDRSSAVLAVAAASSAEEEKLLSSAAGVEATELRVADAVVGELRYRVRGGSGGEPAPLRMVATLLGLEVERARSPEWASDEAAHDFLKVVLRRELADAGDILARAEELGSDLSAGGGVVMARAAPHAAQPGDWRARMLMLTLRAVRSGSSGALASALDGDGRRGRSAASGRGCGGDRSRRGFDRGGASELDAGLLADRRLQPPRRRRRRTSTGPARRRCWPRTSARSEDRSPMAFEDTGAYRLLLPALSEDPAELERFFDETVAPLAAYDEQYETELVATVEAYLDNDGNVTPTAETLFTHRHTVRYRLERVRELCGHDLSSTEGREKLGLGLKAMRVLGIQSPSGPAHGAGHEGREGDGEGSSSGGRTRTLAVWTKTRSATSYTTPERAIGQPSLPEVRSDCRRCSRRVDQSGYHRPIAAPRLRCSRVSAPTVLIMAAGQGTRMRSAIPKVLHPVCGRALVVVADHRRARGGRRPDRGDHLARPRHLRRAARGGRDRAPARGRRDRRRGPRGAARDRGLRRRCSCSPATCRSSPPS